MDESDFVTYELQFAPYYGGVRDVLTFIVDEKIVLQLTVPNRQISSDNCRKICGALYKAYNQGANDK